MSTRIPTAASGAPGAGPRPLLDGAPEHHELPAALTAPVTAVLERAAADGLDLADRATAANRCIEVSQQLAAALRAHGLPGRAVLLAWRHYGGDDLSVCHAVALTAGRRVLDLTANQYAYPGEAFPVPYSPTLAAWKGWLDHVQFRGRYKAPVQLVLPDVPLPEEKPPLAELRAWIATQPASC